MIDIESLFLPCVPAFRASPPQPRRYNTTRLGSTVISSVLCVHSRPFLAGCPYLTRAHGKQPSVFFPRAFSRKDQGLTKLARIPLDPTIVRIGLLRTYAKPACIPSKRPQRIIAVHRLRAPCPSLQHPRPTSVCSNTGAFTQSLDAIQGEPTCSASEQFEGQDESRTPGVPARGQLWQASVHHPCRHTQLLSAAGP